MNRALLINCLCITNKAKKQLFLDDNNCDYIKSKYNKYFSYNNYNQSLIWLKAITTFKRGFFTCFDLDYPAYLKPVNDCPFLIFWEGNTNFKTKNCITIVGTRKPTGLAKQKAFELGLECGFNKKQVISGFAVGIDQASMKGCLAAKGKVIGVLGCGLQYKYPYNSESIKNELLNKDGLLLSQYAPNSPPRPYHFPQRNIILAGLSKTLIVIEAPRKSGALITAHYAINDNTDVYVHSVGVKENIYSEGSKKLATEGAPIIKGYEDIFGKSNVKITQKSENKIENKDNKLFRFFEVCYNVKYENES